MTERTDPTASQPAEEPEPVDPAAKTQPAEGGRDEVEDEEAEPGAAG